MEIKSLLYYFKGDVDFRQSKANTEKQHKKFLKLTTVGIHDAFDD